MPRGLNRTTIMSHGGIHDAKGVGGTHLKGSVPVPAVLDSIPTTIGTVGNLPEQALAGKGPTTRAAGAPAQTKVRRYYDDEGNPDFPPRVPSTVRPDAATTTAEKAPEPAPAPVAPPAQPQAGGGPVRPPADPAPVTRRDEVRIQDTPVTGARRPDLNLTKRKLTRATVEQLREWCEATGINPAEYVENDDQVTSKLMRQLLAEKHDIEM